jgi:hypothetical protein
MKKLFVTILLVSSPFLQAQMPGGMEGGMKCGMHAEMFHMGGMDHLYMVFKRAENLTEGEVRERVLSLKNSSLEELLRQETEVKIARLRMRSIFSDPNFNEKDAMEAIHRLEREETKLLELIFKTLLKLRELVGEDVYERAIQCGPMEMGSSPGEGMHMMEKPKGGMAPGCR